MPEGSAAEIVDEHYYKEDNWFYKNFDRFSPACIRAGLAREAKNFIGEASASGHLEAALKETAFLLERERSIQTRWSWRCMRRCWPMRISKIGRPTRFTSTTRASYGTPSYARPGHAGQPYRRHQHRRERPGWLAEPEAVCQCQPRQGNRRGDHQAGQCPAQSRAIRIEVSGRSSPPTRGREIVLTGPGLGAVNSFEKPMNVAPVERKLERVGSAFDYPLPACSFAVLRLR